MKYLAKILLWTALGMIGAQAHATIITITPDDCDDNGGTRVCYVAPDGSGNAQPDVATIVGDNKLVEVYKAEVGDPVTEEGGFASSYDTVFDNDPLDPMDATISYVMGDIIDCGVGVDCWLLVKDGKQDPSWYIFDISDWDGWMDIALTGFWPDMGAISNVAIYSNPAPGPLAIMAIGLMGVLSLRRVTKAS